MESIDIHSAKAGKPLVRQVPSARRASKRKPGALKGQIRISKDFDAPLPREMAKAFGIEKCRAVTP